MPTTFRPTVYGYDGMVAAPHYLAALAGASALRDGGSAVDAALAANLVMGVVWPHMCGTGGDLFAQVWSARDGRLVGLNASGRAGAAEVFLAGGQAPAPGQRLVQTDLARTLETIAQQGPTLMYGGALGDRLAAY